jgi:hypothetical protein
MQAGDLYASVNSTDPEMFKVALKHMQAVGLALAYASHLNFRCERLRRATITPRYTGMPVSWLGLSRTK